MKTSTYLITAGLWVVMLNPASAWSQGLFEQALEGDIPASDDAEGQNGAAEAADTEEPFGLASLVQSSEINGYARAAVFIGRVPANEAAEIKNGYGEAALTLRARAADWGDGFAELRLRTGAGSDFGEHRTDFELREAYVNLYLGPLDLRVGHQIIAWGRADGQNPTDNLTPRNMSVRSANPDDRRLGNLAVRAHLNLLPFKLEAVWVPFFAPAQFPKLPLGPPLVLGEPNYPDYNLNKGIGAVRLHIETSSFEGSLSYLIGHANFPGLALQQLLVPPDPLAIVVGFSAYRHMVIGGDFSTAIGDWFGLRGEVAFRRPFDYETRTDVPLPDLQWVVGIDREFFGSVKLIGQYIGRVVIDYNAVATSGLLSGGAPPTPAQLAPLLPVLPTLVQNELQARVRMIHGQQRLDSHSAMMRIQWLTLHDTLSLELMGMVNFSNLEALIAPKIAYTITDALAVTAGADIYLGEDDTLFGMVDETLSAGYVEVKASF